MEIIRCSTKQREDESQSLLPSPQNPRVPILRSGFFHLRSLGSGPDPLHKLICLRSDRVYTIGRRRRHCQIVLHDRCISRRHCQIFLDGSDRKIRLVDGSFLSPRSDLDEIRRRWSQSGCRGLGSRVSLNGVFVNGHRLQRGDVAELLVGDEVLFGCSNRSDRCCRIRFGFIVERVVVSESVQSCEGEVILSRAKRKRVSKSIDLWRGKHEELGRRAALLLSRCQSILRTVGPHSYPRSSLDSDLGKRSESQGGGKEQELAEAVPILYSEKSSKLATEKGLNPDQNNARNRENEVCSVVPTEEVQIGSCNSYLKKDVEIGCYSDGKTFFLNRLVFTGSGAPEQQIGVTLPELLHPVGTLVRVFIATFTSDISWFLSYCQVPNQLPVTIACHSAERCWSASHSNRTFAPYSDYPNLLLVFPPFPDVIAFGKDRKKKGVACHHPKLIVLQREDSIRVIVTSANLVSKQWNQITNTVWWQDFPCRDTPNYSALFCTIETPNPDFAAQLAGFIASLITDVPSQSHWITELTKYDFGGAVAHLVASIPGVHVRKSSYFGIGHCLLARQSMASDSTHSKILGCVQASVVGLSHRFCTTSDSSGAQLKTLASILGKCHENANGTLEVILKRNTNIPADANAVSVLVADLDGYSEGGNTLGSSF